GDCCIECVGARIRTANDREPITDSIQIVNDGFGGAGRQGFDGADEAINGVVPIIVRELLATGVHVFDLGLVAHAVPRVGAVVEHSAVVGARVGGANDALHAE